MKPMQWPGMPAAPFAMQAACSGRLANTAGAAFAEHSLHQFDIAAATWKVCAAARKVRPGGGHLASRPSPEENGLGLIGIPSVTPLSISTTTTADAPLKTGRATLRNSSMRPRFFAALAQKMGIGK